MAKLRATARVRNGGLAGRKQRLLGDLASELGKPVGAIDSAFRAALGDSLDRAVSRGRLTPRGRELALACFDRPQSCDRQALRAQLRRRP